MGRRDWSRRLAVVTMAWVGASACGAADNSSNVASGVTVSDSNGIRIVRFAELGALELTERSTTVAAEAGRQGTELYQVSTARLLDSNRLAVGNSGTSEVLYFDPAGRLLHRVGRAGEGPGEFGAITSFPDAVGDTLTVYDVRLGRLTVLDPAGEVLGTQRLDPPSRAVDLLPLALGVDGRVLAVHGDARIFAASGVRQDTVPLMVIRPASQVDTIALWSGKQWSFASTDRGSFRTEVGFGRSVEASGRDGRAIVGSTDRLALALVDEHGEQLMRIEASSPNRAVTRDNVEQWRAGRLANLPDDVPASIRVAIESAPYNETFPAFSGLLLDADGRIWIGAVADLGTADRTWTVLASSGMPLFRVDLPASARPLDARGDRLVVLDRTDLDEEVLQWIELATPE